MSKIKYDAPLCPLYVGNTCTELDKVYQKGRADAIEQVEEWLKKEFTKQNHFSSNFVPSVVINELAFTLLEQIKSQKNEGE